MKRSSSKNRSAKAKSLKRYAGKVVIVTGKSQANPILWFELSLMCVVTVLSTPLIGSSSGIGQAAAVRFAKEGASVTIHGQSVDRLQVLLSQAALSAIVVTGNKESDSEKWCWRRPDPNRPRLFGRPKDVGCDHQGHRR